MMGCPVLGLSASLCASWGLLDLDVKWSLVLSTLPVSCVVSKSQSQQSQGCLKTHEDVGHFSLFTCLSTIFTDRQVLKVGRVFDAKLGEVRCWSLLHTHLGSYASQTSQIATCNSSYCSTHTVTQLI